MTARNIVPNQLFLLCFLFILPLATSFLPTLSSPTCPTHYPSSLFLAGSLPSDPTPQPYNATSWDNRELLPYSLRLTTPTEGQSPSLKKKNTKRRLSSSSFSSSEANLGTHHLPPLVSKGDVVVVNGKRYKVRRVRFLYKMESPQMKYRVSEGRIC